MTHFNNNENSSNNVFFITEDITLSENEILSENVILVFQGGKITGTGKKIIGNHTKIIAPIGQIFDNGVIVEGTWDIDRAYPQWFGAKAMNNAYNEEWQSASDNSEAINSAITMKGVGEVFLPCGYYIIDKPIIIPVGIQLRGEIGMTSLSDSFIEENQTNGQSESQCEDETFINDGTILVADNFINQFPDNPEDNFIVFVNAKINNGVLTRLTKKGFLAGQITSIRNICFSCKTWDRIYISDQLFPNNDRVQAINPGEGSIISPVITNENIYIESSYKLGCIYAATTLKVDNVRFENFIQAVKFNQEESGGEHYFDVKSITNCDYSCSFSNYTVAFNERKYAFDLGFLGDALLFEHNAIHDGKCNKGVKIQYCGGGRIASNIINADVMISNSKALDFSNNHMEGGGVIVIETSNISMNGNYIERGHKTPIEIFGSKHRDKAILSMHNDAIIFIEQPRNYIEGKEVDGDDINFTIFRNRLRNASEYDIKIDDNVVLNLDQVYRHRICYISEKVYPTGINICKKDNSPLNEFNDFSYMLSQKGTISCNYIVDKSFTLKGINNITVYTAIANYSDVFWLETTGNYMYKYQVIYDKARHLLATRNDSQLFDVYNDSSLNAGVTINTLNGILLCIADNNGNGVRATIRMFRKRGTDWNTGSEFKYVDIPNTNNHYFYDNGISINGYRWKEATINDILVGTIGIESISYQGDNVICRMTGNPNEPDWIAGDVLINQGEDQNWEFLVVKSNN